MKEHFVSKRFNPAAEALIETINEIVESYQAQGYDLSLRQTYYQLVSRDIVENTEQNFKRVGGLVSDARLAGLIDWDAIKDRGRSTEENSHWDSPADILEQDAKIYRIDLWADQPVHVEVMVEKQALEGVLLPVCQQLDIPFSANKGYSSSSALYESGKRLAAKSGELVKGEDEDDVCESVEKRLVILYLGDHDPSGIDMSRDVKDRLEMFSGCDIEVKRLALNMDQIRTFNPPPNPAKMTDSRAKEYVERFGTSSWELDAIEPRRLAQLVTDAVEGLRDGRLWNAAVARQNAGRTTLLQIARNFRTGRTS